MGLKVRKHVHLPVYLLFCFKSFYRSEKGPEPEKKYFSEYGAAKGPVLPNRLNTHQSRPCGMVWYGILEFNVPLDTV